MKMYSEELKEQQPVVYRTISNALKNNRLSHSYLFSGPKGSGKKQTAFLIAQSLVCQNKTNEFACECCSSCLRIKENNYADLVYVDCKDNNIKIKDVENLKDKFDKTALEAAGKKIFIIKNCENLTSKAANSLLKFIEEPSSNLTGIFLTNQIDNVLPTIISRCQNLNFRPLNNNDYYKIAQQKNYRQLICHLISKMVHSVEEVEQLAQNKSFDFALNAFLNFIDDFSDNNIEAVIFLQDAFSKQKKDDDKTLRNAINYFLEIGIIFWQDCLTNYQSNDEEYSQLLSKARNFSVSSLANFIKIFSQCKDNLFRSANCLLCIDQLLYKLKQEVKI